MMRAKIGDPQGIGMRAKIGTGKDAFLTIPTVYPTI